MFSAVFSQPRSVVALVGSESGQVVRHSRLAGLCACRVWTEQKNAEGHKKVRNSVMLCLHWLIVSVSQITLSPQRRYAFDGRESDMKSNHTAYWSKQQFPFKTMWTLSRRWITGLHTRTQEFCCCGFVCVSRARLFYCVSQRSCTAEAKRKGQNSTNYECSSKMHTSFRILPSLLL